MEPWWQSGVLYQIYPRSFADSDGDGIGDLRGVIDHLDHLQALGVDGVWLSPITVSPNADWGYDVADYLDIQPEYGGLDDLDALVAKAGSLGIRILMDLVPNHTSDRHPWFVDSRSSRTARHRDWYVWADPKPDGSPPNNWQSHFGGGAWTLDGATGQCYLHNFTPGQPDLNWWNEEVREAFDGILRFWFDRGVDGIRVDAAPAIGKKEGLPDADYGGVFTFRTLDWVDNPHWDADEVHDVLRRWRKVGEEYDGERMFVAEAVVGSAERLSNYVRNDEMHSAFNFPFMKSAWEAGALRSVIDATLAQFGPIAVPSTWVMSSHDEVRLVTRYGRRTTSSGHFSDGWGEVSDLALGTRRARASQADFMKGKLKALCISSLRT